jgi:hypothetical protein
MWRLGVGLYRELGTSSTPNRGKNGSAVAGFARDRVHIRHGQRWRTSLTSGAEVSMRQKVGLGCQSQRERKHCPRVRQPEREEGAPRMLLSQLLGSACCWPYEEDTRPVGWKAGSGLV